MKKVLVATEKPFAPAAVVQIKEVLDKANYELVLLEKYTEKSELLKAVEDVDALIVRSDKITKEVVDAAKNLKIVIRAGAGYDNLDLEACSANNVVAMNTPGQNSNAVAELAIGMMISLARGNFSGKAGTELRGKNLGIHAYGNVGRCVVEIAKGFGMKIYAHDPYVDNDIIKSAGIIPVDQVGDLYSKCHYVSLHVPANEKTKGCIGYELLSKMPENGILINTARKEVINEEGLLKTFEERKDFKYASDIAPDCKSEIEEKYEGRFFFTPKKMGAQTAEANINAGVAAAHQIIDYIENGIETFKVN
jgi:D-3-phosphoglycerate dehydrogenase